MLLTISTTRAPATDLGWLLHKHPAKLQAFDLAFGQAHVFYPEAGDERCTAAMVLDVDPIGLVRRRGGPRGDRFSLQQYVNDRPYVASSFLSVAIGRVFSSALGGRCPQRPELVEQVWPLEARLAVLRVGGAVGRSASGEEFLRRLFEPLGYKVSAEQQPLDPKFPAWGESNYYAVTLRGEQRLCDLLAHLYVLIPVLDNEKHYWVGQDELEKLLRQGEGWLAQHPEREAISMRYLKHQRSLAREALARLAEEDHPDPDAEEAAHEQEEAALEATVVVSESAGAAANEAADAPSHIPTSAPDEDADERGPTLNTQRLATVLAALRGAGARSVVDLGCGAGKLLRLLLDDRIGQVAGGPRFERIVGMDVSLRSLKIAAERLRLDRLPPLKRQRIELLHGSLLYRDTRLAGFDAATCVEVIEHLDPPRLAAFERTVFEFARPQMVIITTPNREYNVRFETLPAGQLRHRDHRFEWTRTEFETWSRGVAERFGYEVRFLPVGPEDAEVGAPTQMGVFQRAT